MLEKLEDIVIQHPPIRGEERTLDVIVFTYRIGDSLLSCVGSEARMLNNFAWMLAIAGHNVTLVNKNKDEVCRPNSFSNLTILSISQVDFSKRYDVCISMRDSEEAYAIKCDLSLWPVYWLIRTNPSTYGRHKDHRHVYVRDTMAFFIDRLPRDCIDKICFLPTPIPDIKNQDSFSRKEISWMSKHVSWHNEIPQVLQAKVNLFRALGDIGVDYSYNFAAFRDDLDSVLSGCISSVQNICLEKGLYSYDTVIEKLSNSKLCLGCLTNGSYEEAILHNSLPLVWQGAKELNFDITDFKGGASLGVKSKNIGYGFSVYDSYDTIKSKLDRLLNDQSYYNELLSCFYPIARKFTFENSYRMFLDILNGGSGEEWSKFNA